MTIRCRLLLQLSARALPGDEWDEAIELARDGMEEHGANFARILNDDGVEVWSGRNDTDRA